MSAPEPIVVSVDLAVPPPRAFECFAPQFAAWWPAATHTLSRSLATRVRMRAEPGGAIEECDADGPWLRWGTVEACEPGRRLRFTWHPGRATGEAQWVEVRFEPLGTGTRATLTHGGWTTAHTKPEKHKAGWDEILGLLKSELETGDIPAKTKLTYWVMGLFGFALPKTTKPEYIDQQGW